MLPDMTTLLDDPRFWVMIAFFGFIAVFGRKLWRVLVQGLDSRSERIRNELDEARRLREEAQAVLNAYRKKHAECMKEAEGILAQARRDAEAMAAQAQADLKGLLEARSRMAEAKIVQAEKQAIDEVKSHVVDITISAARAIVSEGMRDLPGDDLVRKAIADIERKLH